ncbi:hypothetical protein BZG36_00047 [Bifiguratus adelaidae]|uniref:Dedicator of cytokinesis protein 1 n=1 Tax=Bifiguratus adelaidae TaxID=1938954 RepID=A0A261Y8K3_9FUNG|nr:hypothetical protein BZG36_00047 [Bifiguratus adelaidae]
MSWIPLPQIAHATAIYPYTPPTPEIGKRTRSRALSAASRANSSHDTQEPLSARSSESQPFSPRDSCSADAGDLSVLASLEVGDEIFVLEEQEAWYRGYILRISVTGTKPNHANIGVFPANHVAIKAYLPPHVDPTELMQDVMSIDTQGDMTSDMAGTLINVDQWSSSIEKNPTGTDAFKPARRKRRAPSLPLARFQDSTLAGMNEPLIDEIAACVKDWSAQLHRYLEQRQYERLNHVKDQINFLLQARRQLLLQSQSTEELTNLRKTVVQCMSVMNAYQGLSTIVRHPDDGYILDSTNTSFIDIYRTTFQYQKDNSNALSKGQMQTGNRTSYPSASSSALESLAIGTAQSKSGNKQSTVTNRNGSGKDLSGNNHLFLSFRGCAARICQAGESAQLHFCIYNAKDEQFVSEEYCLTLDEHGTPKVDNSAQACTIFRDLGMKDGGDDLYLVCRVVCVGHLRPEKDTLLPPSVGSHASMLFAGARDSSNRMTQLFENNRPDISKTIMERKGSHGNLPQHATNLPPIFNPSSDLCKRPYGVAVLHLNQITQKSESVDASQWRPPSAVLSRTSSQNSAPTSVQSASSPARDTSDLAPNEYMLNIYSASDDAPLASLHQDIIKSEISASDRLPANTENVVVRLEIYTGEIEDVVSSLPADTTPQFHTRSLRFTDLVSANDSRNDLHVRLEFGSLVQTSRGRSVQVCIALRDNTTGEFIENAIRPAIAEKTCTVWESMVFANQSRPSWGEHICIEGSKNFRFDKCHLFFLVRHRQGSIKSPPPSGPSPPQLRPADNVAESPSNERVFAYGFLSLFAPGDTTKFISNGAHNITLYRYDKGLPHPSFYLAQMTRSESFTPKLTRSGSNMSLRSNGSSVGTLEGERSSTVLGRPIMTRDTLLVTTHLCSTEISQVEFMSKLLEWDHNVIHDSVTSEGERLKVILSNLVFVDEQEVAKVLPKALDALFTILHTPPNRWGELDEPVLKALISVLGIANNKRFTRFQSVFAEYIDKQYPNTVARAEPKTTPSTTAGRHGVHNNLLKAFISLANDGKQNKRITEFRAALKVWNSVFSLIVHSREIIRLSEDEDRKIVNEALFKQDIKDVLKIVHSFLDESMPMSAIGTQTLIIQHYVGLMRQLSRVLTAQELASAICEIMATDVGGRGKISSHRLATIISILNCETEEMSKIASLLFDDICVWASRWIGSFEALKVSNETGDSAPTFSRVRWQENLRLATTIVARLLDHVPQPWTGLNQEDPVVLETFDAMIASLCPLLLPILDAYMDLYSQVQKHMNGSKPHGNEEDADETDGFLQHSIIFMAQVQTHMKAPDHVEQMPLGLQVGLSDLAIVFLEIAHITPRPVIRSLLMSLPNSVGREESLRTYTNLCAIIELLAPSHKGDGTNQLTKKVHIIPDDWLSVRLLAYQILLVDVMLPLSEVMETLYAPLRLWNPQTKDGQPDASKHNVERDQEDELIAQFWQGFHALLLRSLASPTLTIEQQSPQAQRCSRIAVGDLRGAVGCTLLIRSWAALGRTVPEDDDDEGFADAKEDVAFSEDGTMAETVYEDVSTTLESEMTNVRKVSNWHITIGPLMLDLLPPCLLSYHEKLRNSSIQIFLDILAAYYTAFGDLREFKIQVLESLDRMPHATTGEEYQRKKLVNGLLEGVASLEHLGPAFLRDARAFIEEISRFSELLIYVRGIPDDKELFQFERIENTLKLTQFVRLVEKEDFYIKYVHQLVQLQVTSENFLEAALTLKFHAELLPWDDKLIKEPLTSIGYPRETAMARKERLYLQILDYLARDSAWELCIDICKELCEKYDTTLFDYIKMSDMLQRQAKFYKLIISQDRYFSGYYKVDFYGKEFPTSIRNRSFVYRGKSWEKLASFTEHVQARYPDAIILTPTAVTPRTVDGQYIRITAVTPEVDRSSMPFTVSGVAESILEYYEYNNVNTFTFSRPMLRDTEDDQEHPSDNPAADEFLRLWVVKTVIYIEDTFPTVLRRSPVINTVAVELSPIQNAIIAIDNKTKELKRMEAKYRTILRTTLANNFSAHINVNPFTMALKSVVDAPLNGGVFMYRTAFLKETFIQQHPEYADDVVALKESLRSEVKVLAECLELHGNLVTSDLRPLHMSLVDFYHKNFAEEIADLKRSGFPQPSDKAQSTESAKVSDTTIGARGGTNNSDDPGSSSLRTRPSRNPKLGLSGPANPGVMSHSNNNADHPISPFSPSPSVTRSLTNHRAELAKGLTTWAIPRPKKPRSPEKRVEKMKVPSLFQWDMVPGRTGLSIKLTGSTISDLRQVMAVLGKSLSSKAFRHPALTTVWDYPYGQHKVAEPFGAEPLRDFCTMRYLPSTSPPALSVSANQLIRQSLTERCVSVYLVCFNLRYPMCPQSLLEDYVDSVKDLSEDPVTMAMATAAIEHTIRLHADSEANGSVIEDICRVYHDRTMEMFRDIFDEQGTMQIFMLLILHHYHVNYHIASEQSPLTYAVRVLSSHPAFGLDEEEQAKLGMSELEREFLCRLHWQAYIQNRLLKWQHYSEATLHKPTRMPRAFGDDKMDVHFVGDQLFIRRCLLFPILDETFVGELKDSLANVETIYRSLDAFAQPQPDAAGLLITKGPRDRLDVDAYDRLAMSLFDWTDSNVVLLYALSYATPGPAVSQQLPDLRDAVGVLGERTDQSLDTIDSTTFGSAEDYSVVMAPSSSSLRFILRSASDILTALSYMSIYRVHDHDQHSYLNHVMKACRTVCEILVSKSLEYTDIDTKRWCWNALQRASADLKKTTMYQGGYSSWMGPLARRNQHMAPPAATAVETLTQTTESVKDKLANLSVNAPKHPNDPVYRDIKYPPLEDYEYHDRALNADPSLSALLSAVTKRTELTPHIGTELSGIQLSQLTDQQKEELALLLSHRGLVVFRDQDLTPEQQLELGRYFGRLHIHQTAGTPQAENQEEILVVFSDAEGKVGRAYGNRSHAKFWHSDITYERQPAGYTTLLIDELPTSGGDTLWASGYAAYDKLSPAFRKFLEGLTATHSGVEQAEQAKKYGGPIRREPIISTHPIIRTHPVTGYKSLFVNPGFTRRIVELSEDESDAVLQYLFAHLAGGYDFHVRLKWEKNTVAFWDNRHTFHTAIWNFDGQRRHGRRVTPQAEIPYFDPNSKSRAQAEAEQKANGKQ